MGRPPCPKCARPGGLPIAYGFPGVEMAEQAERDEIVLGGCVVEPGSPGLHCRFCAHEWNGGPLPGWWPPEDTATMDPDVRERARRELDDRLARARVVADAFEYDGVAAATVAADAYRRFRARERPDAPLVPSDCVHLAGALDAAEALTRILDPARERYTASDEFVLLGPDDVHRAFRAAEEHARRPVDVLHPEDDDLSSFLRDLRLRDADPSAELVQRGDGSELPPVGRAWSRRLDRVAAEVFDDGSGHGWARFVWGRSTLPPITNEIDVTRGAVRVVALGVLRRGLLDRLDGDAPRDPWPDVANPGIGSFHLGVLAATDRAVPTHGYDPARPDDSAAAVDAVRELARRECERLGPALGDAVGADDLVASAWASRHSCARFPLDADARAAALDPDRTPGVHRARAWAAAGMPL